MMRSVQVGMWDPHPPQSKQQHAPPPAPPLQPRLSSHVSPAKRITFYKSGDSQFGGVKMAVHKRSFKCFDALLDDLSQKVPLPFGVRTVTTPRGTHTISHLEQLQDGGCYLCSDRRQAKPVSMESKHTAWSHSSGRRPHRPDSSSATPPGHVPYRQRRLLLVKNTEPGLRRGVVLSRRVTRSLRAFLDEASDVMQFHVRKLYTVEGRKIDNVQSLMTCPNVLVCVGREAFSPLLVNYVRKGSDEKLPGLGTRTPGNGARSPPHGAQSRASENSEGPDSKKNTVNFGLETKKSIIHPRSDSSTRSARFSMSSEKSNGLSAMSQAHAAILNDDIEKRVVVNKDGSLSVEMRVRFRLHSDETLQWSTRIKKSPSLTNDSISQGQPHYLQQECCSDPDCNSFEPPTQCAIDENGCPCCYQQEEQYDLWENPAHCHKQPVPPSHSTTESHTVSRHSSSSSSSCNSTRVVRCRARLTSCEDGSERSQIVREEVCVTEQHTVGQDVCTLSRSCSRSEVIVNGEEHRPHSCKSGNEEVERPMSAISASSHVLQELKEDDDEEVPPSGSRCSGELCPTQEIQTDDRAASQNGCDDEEEVSTCHCHSASEVEASERASTSKSKAGSFKSIKEANDEAEEVRAVSGLSASSRHSATSLCHNCGGWKAKSTSGCNSRASNRSKSKSSRPASTNSAQDIDDIGSDISKISNKSNLTNRQEVTISSEEWNASLSKTEEGCAEEVRASSPTLSHKSNASLKSGCGDNNVENRSPSVISAKSDHSNCREEAEGENVSERAASAMSAKSATSAQTNASRKSRIKVTPPSTAEDDEENRATSAQSEKSNVSAKESRPASATSTKSQEDPRAASVLSAKSNVSNASAKSNISQTENAEEKTRVASALSVKSIESRSASPKSAKSCKSPENEMQNLEVQSNGKKSRPGSALSVKSIKSDVSKKSKASSVISVKSTKSTKSHVSEKSAQDEINNMEENNEIVEVKSNTSGKESRPASAVSVKSINSQKSSKSEVQNVDDNTRADSSISAKSTSAKESRPPSATSCKSSKSHVSEKSAQDEIKNMEENDECVEVKSNTSGNQSRPASAISIKSINSQKSSKSEVQNVDDNTRAESAISAKSTSEKESRPPSATSCKSSKSHVSEKSAQDEIKNMEENDECVEVKSNTSGNQSRPASAISIKSINSQKSSKSEVQNVDDNTRADSAISAKSTSEKESRPPSVTSCKSNKSHVSEKSCKSEKVVEETRATSAMSSQSHVSNKSEQRSNADQNGEESEGSAVSDKSGRSSKSNCDGIVQNGTEYQADRSASAVSSKSSLSVKSLRSASPAKEKEEDGALSPSSAKSKKSTKFEISDNKGGMLTRKFHVVAVKTPEVANINRPVSSASAKSEKSSRSSTSKENKIVGDQNEDTNEDLVEDQVSKSDIPIQTQELMPENGEQRVPSTLSVRSAKSGRSNKSKCSCEKMEEKNQVEESERAASMSSPKREEEDDSFASVSIVLPEEDHDSGSGESSYSPRRYIRKTASPEICKSAENVEDVEQVAPNNTNAIDIPTIETPGDNDQHDSEEKTRRASSCSTKSIYSVKSTKSKKSCSSCGKPKSEVCANGTASPVASVKSVATTKTDQLTAPENRTSAMSCTSAKSERKTANSEDAGKSSEEGSDQACKEEEETNGARAQSKSPCRLRPKSSVSNISKPNSSKAKDDVQSVKSSQSKEGSPQPASRPASKGDTCSESILSHSLSAADLQKEAKATPPDSPRSKCSKSSNKSAKSQRGNKEAEPALTPSSLPNASPNEVVSDWLKSIPVNVLALGEEEGLAEKSEAMVGQNDDDNEGKGEEEEEEAKAGEERGEREGAKGGKVETFEIRQNGIATENDLPKNWHPSTAVMKVLLSSSMGRCRSMPEVSPVYGRRLSTSAKELLDCLTQLQLIEPAGHKGYSVHKDQRPQFEDIITILQSLWLNEPGDITVDPKDPGGTDHVSPPRSSSGVGMSSGSGGSGKDNGTQENNPKANVEGIEASTKEDSPDSPKESDNPSSLDKNYKSPTDNELDTQEGSSTDHPPAVSRAPLTKGPSQDPNPAWVLNLLKKLEKQFINHYVNAMADFKEKWDLEDSLILDRMILELKDEVSQRIEKSVQKEMKKIHGRAGKGMRVPRPPPGSHLSRDSTMTEKRRQRLMVMKKQSIKTGESASDGELTGDNSDQSRDDEYCPCEACVRKKMAARPVKTNPCAIEAPVHVEFDLFRILQHKKTPAPPAPKPEVVQEEPESVEEEDARSLGVVQEEEEEEESKAGPETAESAEEDKCQCHCSEGDSDGQTEESDKETVREKSLPKEATKEEEAGNEEEVSTGERTSEQEGMPTVCVTEGEDADVEDEGTEEKSEEEESKAQTDRDQTPLSNTSVESQSGSLVDTDERPSRNSNKDPCKLASPCGTSHRRVRSPARAKRRKAKNSDSDEDSI